MFISVRKFTALSLLSSALVACGGSDLSGNALNTDPSGLLEAALIEEFLDADLIDNIELDSGEVPILSGDWKSYTVDTSWNWQLLGDLNSSYEADVYVVDMFAQLTDNSIPEIKAQGRDVLCYFSAGTYEPWRPDIALFEGLDLGNPHIGYPSERWLDVREDQVSKIMANRMDIAKKIGCDGVELDNVDAFVNDNGFGLTQNDALVFSRVLANEAHKRGLAVALKNNVELVTEVVDYFDIIINEQCFQYNECEGYLPFIEAGKPMFNAEYTAEHIEDPVAREALCQISRGFQFQTLFLPLELDGSFRLSCW